MLFLTKTKRKTLALIFVAKQKTANETIVVFSTETSKMVKIVAHREWQMEKRRNK